ncbi:MAG: hypothetical protein JRL30_01265 [Deltaproteobacteria bacterium]|nr:hypothetical protein [Deltaproteobacteria bacterium]
MKKLGKKFKADFGTCTRCGLAEFRRKIVLGEGDLPADLLFVGEAPGKNEDLMGRPFVGPSGRLLHGAIELAGDKVDFTPTYFITNSVACLDGYAQVRTEEGPKRINWIVKHRWSGRVHCVLPNGELALREIVGWHRTRRDGRKLLHLSFEGIRGNPKGFTGVRLTEDHLVSTSRGWIPAAEIRDGDLVSTGTPAPGPRAEQIIIGSMLGDGTVSSFGQFAISHSERQAEYLRLKAAVLDGFDSRVSARHQTLEPCHVILRTETKLCPFMRDLWKTWYPHGKVFHPESLRKLGPLGLAVWFLDDGHQRANKGGQSKGLEFALPLEEANAEIAKAEFERRGYSPRIKKFATWRLYFRSVDARRFLTEIAHLVPPTLKYKLPPNLRDVKFCEEYYAPEPATSYFKPAIVVPYDATPDLVYCIDVEEAHNFVTAGAVVHNCRPTDRKRGDNRPPTQEEQMACWPRLHRIERAVKPVYIIALGREAERVCKTHWPDTIHLVHPAYILRRGREQSTEYRMFVRGLMDVFRLVEALGN